MTGSHHHEERPNRVPWPPIAVLTSVIAGLILNRLAPLAWPTGSIGDLLIGLGIVLIGLAIAIDVAAMREMHNARTTILPHQRADHLVTGGVFRFSRNPIYTANVMLLAGLGLLLGNIWLLLLAPVNGIATQKLAIEPEEAHLEARFGKTYRDYKKKVNRWV